VSITNLDIMKKLEEIASDTDTRLATMEQSLKKLNEAVYGNGEPGIKERIREHEKVIAEITSGGTQPLRAAVERIKRLEETHAVCPIVRIDRMVDDIEDRHRLEDEGKKVKEEDQKEARSEQRKFQWTLLMFIITTAVNLILTFYGMSK
jgi:hypothetical protein